MIVTAALTLALPASAQEPAFRFSAHEDSDFFGRSFGGIGDVDGDSVPDVLVGAHAADVNGLDSGAAYVFSGSDGELLVTLLGDSAADLFGTSVAGVEDADADGIGDFVVAAHSYVKVFSGANGSILHSLGTDTLGGTQVAGASDCDGDGHADLIVGQPYANVGGAYVGFVDVAP